MKKILMMAAILFLSVSMLSASLISFGFGANMKDPVPFNEETGLSPIDNWMFGGEIRLGVLFAEASASALYDATNDRISGLLTFGTSLSLFDLVHLGVGAGPAVGIDMAGGAVDWAYMNSTGTYVGSEDLGSALDAGLVHYRIHGDVKIGRISAGLTYLVPSDGYTVTDNDPLALIPDWDAATVGASLLFWLF